MGVTVYVMLIGGYPFADGAEDPCLLRMSGDADIRAKLDEMAVPLAISERVRKCLSFIPEERPTAEELSGSGWLEKDATTTTTAVHELKNDNASDPGADRAK